MRSFSRLIACLLGLALAAFGVIVAVEAWLLASDRGSWLVPRSRWDTNVRDLQWDDTSVTVTCALLTAAGIGLLLLQLLPRVPIRLRVRDTPDGREVWISRRGLEGQLARLADRDPEVLAPNVRVTKRKAKVKAAFPTHAQPAEVGARLRTMAAQRLDRADLERPLKVNVRLRPARKRVS